MKRFIRYYRRWRYRRLYRKLFFVYAPKDNIAYNARRNADEAFYYLTGETADEFFQRP